MSKFTPYADESASIEIGSLTVENRLDRVSIFGSIDLTKDQEGLALVLALKELIWEVASELEGMESAGVLPQEVEVEQTVTIANPFK